MLRKLGLLGSIGLLGLAGCETDPKYYTPVQLAASFDAPVNGAKQVVAFSKPNRAGLIRAQAASQLFTSTDSGFSVEVLSEIDRADFQRTCEGFSARAGGIGWNNGEYCSHLNIDEMLSHIESDIYSSLTSANDKRPFAEYYVLDTNNMRSREKAHYKNQLPQHERLSPVLAPDIGKQINFDQMNKLKLRYELLGIIFSGETDESAGTGYAWDPTGLEIYTTKHRYRYRTDHVGADFNFRVTAAQNEQIVLDDVFTISRPVATRNACLNALGSGAYRACVDDKHGDWRLAGLPVSMASLLLTSAPTVFNGMSVFNPSSREPITLNPGETRYTPSRLVERPEIASYLSSINRVSGGQAEFKIASLGLIEEAPRALEAPSSAFALSPESNPRYAGDVQRCIVEVRNSMQSDRATGSLLSGLASLAGAGEVAAILDTTNRAIIAHDNLTGEERKQVDNCLSRKGH